MEWLTKFSEMAAVDQKSLLGRYRLMDVLLRKLTEVKASIDETAARLSAAEKHAEQVEHDLATLRVEAGELAAIIQRLEERGRQLDRELAEVSTTATVRLQRIEQLDAEMRALKATRSWRWSQPIRAIERWLARRRSS